MKIEDFINTAKNNVSYNYSAKKKFHSQGAAVMRQLAKALNFKTEERGIHHNQGGIAVSGEIILHSNNIYICFIQSASGLEGFYWRTCKNRKDYTGGPNQWESWESLKDLDHLALKMWHRFNREQVQEML